jgi:hypothetical protein
MGQDVEPVELSKKRHQTIEINRDNSKKPAVAHLLIEASLAGLESIEVVTES